MFEEMQSDGRQANVITHNIMISACSKGRQWQLAIGSFGEMQSHVREANVFTVNATISAC